MTLRVVLLDLDDTLCNTIATRPIRARLAFGHAAAVRPDLDVEWLVQRLVEEIGGRRVTRTFEQVLAEAGLSGTLLGEEVRDRFLHHHAPIDLYAGVRETLAELRRDYRLGIVTNADERYQIGKLAHLGLTDVVVCMVCSGSLGIEKPDPRIFAHALDLIEARPEEAVYVGDRLDVDVGGALAAGLRAVWFNHWGGTLTPADPQPHAIITHFSELPATLRRLQ